MSNGPWDISMKKLGGPRLGCTNIKLLPWYYWWLLRASLQHMAINHRGWQLSGQINIRQVRSTVWKNYNSKLYQNPLCPGWNKIYQNQSSSINKKSPSSLFFVIPCFLQKMVILGFFPAVAKSLMTSMRVLTAPSYSEINWSISVHQTSPGRGHRCWNH